MKIHTTQDLSVLARQGQVSSINNISLSNIRFKENSQAKDAKPDTPTNAHSRNYKIINMALLLSGLAINGALAVALSRKTKAQNKILPEELKKTVKNIKDVTVGNIKEKAVPEKTKYDKALNSKWFDSFLKGAENEPVMQAAMAALICILLRPATIMALPSKNGKENNMYASAHSMSSGVMGLLATIFIAQPFKSSASYTMKNLYKEFSEDALKRLSPKLDLNSIVDKATGKRKPVEEWLFKDGNKFLKEFKDVEKIPMLKPFNEISAESFKAFGADVDWAAWKGKSFNDVLTKDGKKLYDTIDWERLGIVVKQEYKGNLSPSKKLLKESTGDAKVLLRDLDRGFLEKIIQDAESGSNWKKLDINSVYKDNKVVDFKKWKDLEGKQWKLDLDNTYISSPYDTATYLPRISGKHRIEPTGEIKYAAYLKNGKNGELGSIVDEEMASTQKRNEVRDKLLTWAPDILTRPLVATATIALIPLALLKIFHLEKKKPQEPVVNNQQQVKVSDDKLNISGIETSKQENTSFKGSKNNSEISFRAQRKPNEKELKGLKKLLQDWIVKPLSRIYGKRMYESKGVDSISERLSKIPGGMTNHMSSLGALLTSGVYMYQTLNKKDLDDDRKRTLAINQGLCFIVPTICAYTVDKWLKKWTKEKIEYRYAGLREYDINMAKLAGKPEEEIKKMQEGLGKKLNGVRTLITLAIFALIYRYIAPVLITPFANRIGDRAMEKRRAKVAAEQEAAAKTIAMNQNQVKIETATNVHSAA